MLRRGYDLVVINQERTTKKATRSSTVFPRILLKSFFFLFLMFNAPVEITCQSINSPGSGEMKTHA
jgi:hypothetical protein